MSTDNKEATVENTQTQTKEKSIHDADISFEDFERLRKGEKISVSAAEETQEQEETKENSEVSENESEEETLEAQEDENESDEEESQEEVKPKKQNGVQKRIGKLAKKLSEKDQEIAFLKGQLAAKGKTPDQQEAEAESEQTENLQTIPKPKADDFETHDEYVEAIVDWKDQVKEQKRQAAEAKTQSKKEQDTLLETHNSRVDEYKEKDPEFIEVVQDFFEEHGNLNFSVAAEKLICESDLGPQIIKELFKDKKEFDRLNSLPFSKAAKEIGKLEDKILAKTSQSKTTTEKKLTTAPAPIAPVGNRGSSKVNKSIYDKDISFEDYEKIRMAELKSKRG